MKQLLIALILSLFLIGCNFSLYSDDKYDNKETENINDTEEHNMTDKILLKTTQGDIVIELYDNMPITTGNFKKLVEEGFYNNLTFHRVIQDFMIQGGCPDGTGAGGPGYKIKDEFVKGSSNLRGTISMANAGPNTGGSQFFINLVDNTYLDWDKEPQTSKHPVFGKVVEGMDIVDAIGNASVDQFDRPMTDIKIIEASVVES